MAEHPSRKLAVIVHADVVGSTRLVQQSETLAHARIQDAFRRFSLTIEAYNGVTHELRGDALVAEFARASDAVAAGLVFQIENTDSNARLEDDLRPRLRIGISLGEVVIADSTVTGAGVVLAQRVEQLAEPGGVCITGAVHEAVPQYLPLDYSDLGKREVKGFEEPVQVYSASVKIGKQVPSPEPAVSGEAHSRKPKRLWAASAIALLILVAGALAWWQPWKPESAPASMERMAFPLPKKPSIAVLPFDNMSDDPDQDHIVDGITENIIMALSQVSSLFVIARNSTFTYKDKPVKTQRVAEDLGVRYVLEGSVQKSGQKMRITAQLIDALSGNHLWAERYDRNITDLFALQDEITERIVTALRIELTDGEEMRVHRRHTHSLEAWDQLSRGVEHFYRHNKNENARARQWFEKAIAIDGEYALAYALLAWTHWVDAQHEWAESSSQAFARAAEMAEKAQDLDDALPDVYALQGAINLFKREHDAALASGERAVALNPNHATNMALLAMILRNTGQPKQAIRRMKTAMRLSPYYPAWFLQELGFSYMNAKQHEDALAAFEKFLERSPLGAGAAHAHVGRALAYHALGREDAARAEIAEAVEADPAISVGHFRRRSLNKDRASLERTFAVLRGLGLPE